MTVRAARRIPLRVAIASIAAATALLLTGCSTTALDPPATSRPTSVREAAPDSELPSAAVIGDSIAIGLGVPAEDAWPLVAAARLGWTLTDFAESGAGFTRQGVNSHRFDDQVSAVIRLQPQVVLVAATINDAATARTDPAAVSTATHAAIERLSSALPDTTLVGMGAVWGATAAPPVARVLDDALHDAVLEAGGHWLAIGQTFLGRADLLQSDGIHPNAAGQALLGEAVSDAIAKAGIEPSSAHR